MRCSDLKWRRRTLLVSIVLLAGAHHLALATDKACPVINTTLDDDEVNPVKPVQISIWVEAGVQAKSVPKSIVINFVNSDAVSVSPSEMKLNTSGVHTKAVVTFSPPNSGLVVIKAKVSGWPHDCGALDLPVDTGFKHVARIDSDLVSMDGETGARKHLMGGDEKLFVVSFKTMDGSDLQLGAPVSIELKAPSGVRLSKDHKTWDYHLLVPANGNNSKSEPIYIRLPENSAKDARIYVAVKRESGERNYLNGSISFDFDYPWWERLVAILAGCLLYSLVEAVSSGFLHKFKFGDTVVNVVAVMLAGIVAFLIQDTRLLGFSIDGTTIKGNVLFGLLIGCLGLEGLIKRVREFAKGSTDKSISQNRTLNSDNTFTPSDAEPKEGTGDTILSPQSDDAAVNIQGNNDQTNSAES